MSEPVDLLLITWNRREYVEKTLPNLFASASDFRLYCWDNASHDGTADLISSLDDPRVVKKHFSPENVLQRTPTLWFFEQAQSDVVGKVDDDILLPDGWIERIAPLVRGEPRFAALACWIFMPEDWDESVAAHKIVEVGGTRVVRNIGVAGQSFLARLEVLRRYIIPDSWKHHGFPIDHSLMSADGLINGYPLPMLFAHNMDDPRSPHCIMNRPGGFGEQAALTARHRGFQSAEEYGKWIAEDAATMLRESLDFQLRRMRNQRNPTLTFRIQRKLARLLGRTID